MEELYPHNKKVYNMALSYFRETNKVAIIQATGTGKGFLAGAFVNIAFRNSRVLILAPNNDIKINYENNIGLKNNNRIKIETYPGLLSLYKSNKSEFLRGAKNIDLLIVDEFHRLGAEKWGMVVKELIDIVVSNNRYVLGLTATPVRYNDNSILLNPNIDEEEKLKLRKARNMADEIFEGNIIQGVTLEEAVYSGILPSFKYILGCYGYENDLKEGYEKLSDLKEMYGESNTSIRRLERKLNDIRDKFGNENDNLRNLIQSETKNLSSFQKWIVFCRNSEELVEVESKLSYWFGKPLNRYKDGFKVDETSLNLYTVYSNYNISNNSKNLKAFYAANKGLNIITCINKLNEGAHVPNVTGIIMLRSTLSPIVYLQQIGRALSAGNKNYPIIFDFMGNIENMQKVNNGEDEYVNSIRKSAEMVKGFNNGSYRPEFLNDKDVSYYRQGRKTEPKIIIKDNNIVSLSRLFGDIQDLLNTHSSLIWSDIELKILVRLYELGGAVAVSRELKKRSLSDRSLTAIDAKAKEMGLVYNPKKGQVKINKDNTLEWTPEDDKLIMETFEALSGRTTDEIVSILQREKLPNREADQIDNRRQHIKNNRGAKETGYARQGLRWEDWEIQTLIYTYSHKDNFKDNSVLLLALSRELERSPEAILSKGQELGYYLQERNFSNTKVERWSLEEDEFLWKNRNILTLKELSEKLGRSTSAIDKRLRRLKRNAYAERKKNTYHGNSNPRNWTELENSAYIRNLDKSFKELCKAIPTKTPKQIKKKILKDIENGMEPIYKNDTDFKKIG